MRPVETTSCAASSRPLRTTSWTSPAMRSTNVDEPGSFALNRTIVVLPKTLSPVVRSSVTS